MNRIKLEDSKISKVNLEDRRNLNLTVGDTVKVSQKIVDKGKTRLQLFEGVVISFKHGSEAGSTFTVRRVGKDKVGVEKIFPLYSPLIDKIEIVKRTKVRRAKLYFLRRKTKKQIKEKLRNFVISNESSISESEYQKMMEEQVKKEQAEQEEERGQAAQEEQGQAKGEESAPVEHQTQEETEAKKQT